MKLWRKAWFPYSLLIHDNFNEPLMQFVADNCRLQKINLTSLQAISSQLFLAAKFKQRSIIWRSQIIVVITRKNSFFAK